MHKRRPSAGLVVAVIALVVSLGGVSAAATGLINGHFIAPGTVGHRQLAKHSVSGVNLARGAVGATNLSKALITALNTHAKVTLPGQSGTPGQAGATGATGAQGAQGAQGQQGAPGAQGSKGDKGDPGANPAVPVVNVPAISGSSGNPNPDSGAPGDGGWYFSGNGSGGSAQFTDGALELQGVGVDSNTAQGGIGIAKAYDNVPVAQLNALAYDWTVDTPHAGNSPTIHVTVNGASTDSKFSTGFANFVFQPAVSNTSVTVLPQVGYHSDGFTVGANWYSTGAGCNKVSAGCTATSNPGGQDHPQPWSYFVAHNPNAVITQISLDNGGSSGASGAFDGVADSLLIGFSGSPFTRYDFGG